MVMMAVSIMLVVFPLATALAQAQDALPYAEALKDYEDRGLLPIDGIDVLIQGEDFIRQGGGKTTINQNLGGITGRSIQWGDKEGHWLEWEFSIPQDGLYNIAVRYYPKAIEDPYLAPLFMVRDLAIDGRYPFREMEEIRFSHIWEKNKEEEEIRRSLKSQNIAVDLGLWSIRQKPHWRLEALSDFSTSILDPYLFYLRKGRHALRMTSLAKPLGQYSPRSEAMDLDYILIYSPKKTLTYKEVEKKYRRDGIKGAIGIVVKFEGEESYTQGGPSYSGNPIRGDDYVTGAVPFIRAGGEPDEDFYNALGHWYQPGHWIEWKFTVPEGGLYKIAFKYFQGTIAPIPVSLRSVKIDGEHPFEEMKAYPFQYAGGRYNYSGIDNLARRLVPGERVVARWTLHPLSDAEGSPYLFHLAPGEHTLEIKPVLGPVLSVALQKIGLARQEMIQLEIMASEIIARGGDLRKVDVAKEIPDLKERISRILTELEEVSKSLTDFNGGAEPPIAESIKMIRDELVGIAKKPRAILDLLDPNRVDPSLLSNVADQAAAFTRTLSGRIERLPGPQLQTALEFDYIVVASQDVELRLPPRSPFRGFVRGWMRFVRSFTQKEE